jgi:uncharacterized protein (DUF934 family)
MRRILLRRELVADAWRYPGEEGTGPEVLAFAALAAMGAADATGTPGEPLGVRIGPVDEPEALAPWLPRLALVVVQFEKIGDGRGYSQGQLLRQRFGYAGELRAAGAIKRDQLFLLARCGFDAFDFDAAEDPAAALAHLQRYSVAYQGASGGLVRPAQRRP